jgi:hypothetical protein
MFRFCFLSSSQKKSKKWEKKKKSAFLFTHGFFLSFKGLKMYTCPSACWLFLVVFIIIAVGVGIKGISMANHQALSEAMLVKPQVLRSRDLYLDQLRTRACAQTQNDTNLRVTQKNVHRNQPMRVLGERVACRPELHIP